MVERYKLTKEFMNRRLEYFNAVVKAMLGEACSE